MSDLFLSEDAESSSRVHVFGVEGKTIDMKIPIMNTVISRRAKGCIMKERKRGYFGYIFRPRSCGFLSTGATASASGP